MAVIRCRKLATRRYIVSPPIKVYVTALPCKILITTLFVFTANVQIFLHLQDPRIVNVKKSAHLIQFTSVSKHNITQVTADN